MLSRIAYTALTTFLLTYLMTSCSVTTAPTDASSLTTDKDKNLVGQFVQGCSRFWH